MDCGGEEGCMGRKQEVQICGFKNVWELLLECAEKKWDLDVKQVKAQRTENKRDVDGGQMAAAKASTIKQMRK